MNELITIVPLAPKHILAIEHILHRRITDVSGSPDFPRITKSIELMRQSLSGQRPDFNCWVAGYNFRIAGTICLQPSSAYNLIVHKLPRETTGEIVKWYTRPHFGGRGVGRALFDHINYQAVSLGLAHLVLDSGPLERTYWPFYTKMFGNEGVIIPNLDGIGQHARSWCYSLTNISGEVGCV